MEVKGIKLSEIREALELLKNLCRINKSCSTCWLYDPEEKETACFLEKTKENSLAGNIEAAQINISNEHSCIMPECPYCPSCDYGLIIYPEDAMPGDEDIRTEWRCLYDPEVKENEAAAVPDSMADYPGADQDDRSDS